MYTWRLKNILLKNIKEEIKKYMEANEKENTTTPNLLDAAKAVIREVCSNPGLLNEGRKVSNTQINLTLKRSGKITTTTTKKAKTSRREIIKIRAEINGIKIMIKNNRSMKTGAGSLKEVTELINC